MSKMCKEFLLHRIAKLDNGNKFDKNKMTHNNPCYNFVSRTATNNGISDYVDDNGTEPYPAGTITLAFGGSIGSTFVQPKPYYTGQNVGVIALPDGVSEEAKVYFAISLEKMCKCKYVAFADEINKYFKKDLTVILPVIENPNPDHEYTVDDIDWQYMHDHITELERDRITELDAYLQATGLNDCRLTKEDKDVLSLKPNYGKFMMHDVFEKLKAPYKGIGKKQDNVSKVQNDEFNLPLINCKYNNNGIMYFGRKTDYTYYKNVLSIIYNGPPTEGQTYYQEEIGVYTDAYLVALKDKNIIVNREIGLYLTAVVNASIHNEKKRKYSRGNKATWENKVENDEIILPVKSDGTPDFDYMERYIRALEKVVISDVVKYKDKVIETTKAVVGV